MVAHSGPEHDQWMTVDTSSDQHRMIDCCTQMEESELTCNPLKTPTEDYSAPAVKVQPPRGFHREHSSTFRTAQKTPRTRATSSRMFSRGS